jgi:hypothetical protein
MPVVTVAKFESGIKSYSDFSLLGYLDRGVKSVTFPDFDPWSGDGFQVRDLWMP